MAIAIVIVLQNPCGFYDCDCNDSWLSLSLLLCKVAEISHSDLRELNRVVGMGRLCGVLAMCRKTHTVIEQNSTWVVETRRDCRILAIYMCVGTEAK